MIVCHHLNCVSACPLGGRLMDGRSRSAFERGCLCCHCLLLETDAGLVLVDTGYGLNDVRHPQGRLSSLFLRLMAPDFREEMTAVRQVQRLGFAPGDVRHIVLTHLDFDHAGGLDDFPAARVHLLRDEQQAAQLQRTWLDRQRFRPQQWASSMTRWHSYQSVHGDPWYGFRCVRQLAGLPPEILLVPLTGHTLGHAGVAVRLDGRWLLMAGDAYFHHREMDPLQPWAPPGLRLYQSVMDKDRQKRLHNQQRLRQLASGFGQEIELCSAHDPAEFERASGRDAGEAVPRRERPAQSAATLTETLAHRS